jgi:hypothetical protein
MLLRACIALVLPVQKALDQFQKLRRKLSDRLQQQPDNGNLSATIRARLLAICGAA